MSERWISWNLNNKVRFTLHPWAKHQPPYHVKKTETGFECHMHELMEMYGEEMVLGREPVSCNVEISVSESAIKP